MVVAVLLGVVDLVVLVDSRTVPVLTIDANNRDVGTKTVKVQVVEGVAPVDGVMVLLAERQ